MCAPAHSEAATDIEYDRIGQLLESSALSPTPGEAHGILCGLICGGSPDPVRAWLEQVLPSPDPDASDPLGGEVREGLDNFARQALDRIRSQEMGIDPLLPEDLRPLVERATALYDWVRGFLYALGVLGISERDLSEQGREAMRDFADLTRLDLDALDEGEDNENALAELVEFVRVAALLIEGDRAGVREEGA